jgi:hypothetical protein
VSRTDDHRKRILVHDLPEERQAIHARHFEIEDDDVGALLFHFLHGDQRVVRNTRLNAALRAQECADGLPDDGRIVDDEDMEAI